MTATTETKPIRADIPEDVFDHLVRIQDAVGAAVGVGSLPRPAALAHIIRQTDPDAAAASYVARLQALQTADHAANA